jgi:hypothetical protein
MQLSFRIKLDCFASLAMTERGQSTAQIISFMVHLFCHYR